MTIAKVKDFVEALKLEAVRVRRPKRFIFLCGGKIKAEGARRSPSLRDFLYNILVKSQGLSSIGIVLAETANDLFKESKYRDLIKFEEDIAQISDLILLVGESAGSLTELGAFSMNVHISERLLILVKTSHYEETSFIRDGPIRYLENEHGEASVSAFPWDTFKNGDLKKRSLKPHINNIASEITERIGRGHSLEGLDWSSVRHKMIIVYWATYVLRTANLSDIHLVASYFPIEINLDAARRFLYCMRVAGWIGEKKYGHTYYFPKFDVDPFSYSFNDDAKTRDPIRWKRDIVRSLKPKLDSVKPVTSLIGMAG